MKNPASRIKACGSRLLNIILALSAVCLPGSLRAAAVEAGSLPQLMGMVRTVPAFRAAVLDQVLIFSQLSGNGSIPTASQTLPPVIADGSIGQDPLHAAAERLVAALVAQPQAITRHQEELLAAIGEQGASQLKETAARLEQRAVQNQLLAAQLADFRRKLDFDNAGSIGEFRARLNAAFENSNGRPEKESGGVRVASNPQKQNQPASWTLRHSAAFLAGHPAVPALPSLPALPNIHALSGATPHYYEWLEPANEFSKSVWMAPGGLMVPMKNGGLMKYQFDPKLKRWAAVSYANPVMSYAVRAVYRLAQSFRWKSQPRPLPKLEDNQEIFVVDSGGIYRWNQAARLWYRVRSLFVGGPAAAASTQPWPRADFGAFIWPWDSRPGPKTGAYSSDLRPLPKPGVDGGDLSLPPSALGAPNREGSR